MNAQKHQIQRQIFEIRVSSRDLANTLHDELSRMQTESVEKIVDACCSEMSSGDRVHRLGRVEVDLGQLSLVNLKQSLEDKLGRILREELAQKIRAVEEESARLGEDPAVQARIELVSLFARTGTLPFWADAGNAKLVDETVEWLLARAPRDLRALVQWLAGDRHALERLVRHVDVMRLLALLKVLVDARGSRVADARAAEAWEVLGALGEGTSSPNPLSNSAASPLRGEGASESIRTLEIPNSPSPRSEAKLERGLGGEALVVTAGEALPPHKVPATFADVGQHVSARVPPTFHTPHDRPSPGFSNAGGTPNSPATRAKTVGSPPPASTFADVGQHPSHNVPTPLVWLAILTTAASSQRLTDAPQFWEQALARLATMAGASYASLLARWSHAPSDDASVFATLARELFAVSYSATDTRNDLSHEIQRPLPRGTTTSPTRTTTSPTRTTTSPTRTTTSPTRTTTSPTRTTTSPTRYNDLSQEDNDLSHEDNDLSHEDNDLSHEDNDLSHEDNDLSQEVQRPLPGGTTTSPRRYNDLSHGVNVLSEARSTSTRQKPLLPQPTRAKHLQKQPQAKKPSPSTDPDEVYLDTSGLVLLWPFLGNFFGRIGLVLEGKTFVDDAARHRSVFLLHWLTTGEWNPPEFRLPLAKVLCGVPLEEVLDTPEELTDAEQTEGSTLLAATLEHLKGFGFLDLEHFRRSFLFRRGVLTTQNNTWLLRVERAPYDLVLQKLPWPLQWIMLPWMAAPLYVEWVK